MYCLAVVTSITLKLTYSVALMYWNVNRAGRGICVGTQHWSNVTEISGNGGQLQRECFIQKWTNLLSSSWYLLCTNEGQFSQILWKLGKVSFFFFFFLKHEQLANIWKALWLPNKTQGQNSATAAATSACSVKVGALTLLSATLYSCFFSFSHNVYLTLRASFTYLCTYS